MCLRPVTTQYEDVQVFEAVSLASWPSAPLVPGLCNRFSYILNLGGARTYYLFSPHTLYRHLVGILGSPGSALEADGHARCCEQGPGSSPLLLSLVGRASWRLHGPLSHSVTPTDQATLRTRGLWGQETEHAGDLRWDRVEPSVPSRGSQDCEGPGWVSAEWVPPPVSSRPSVQCLRLPSNVLNPFRFLNERREKQRKGLDNPPGRVGISAGFLK